MDMLHETQQNGQPWDQRSPLAANLLTFLRKHGERSTTIERVTQVTLSRVGPSGR